MSDIYCGAKKLPKGKHYGTYKQCAKKKQTRLYGINKIEDKYLINPKKKKMSIHSEKIYDEAIKKAEQELQKEMIDSPEYKKLLEKRAIEKVKEVKNQYPLLLGFSEQDKKKIENYIQSTLQNIYDLRHQKKKVKKSTLKRREYDIKKYYKKLEELGYSKDVVDSLYNDFVFDKDFITETKY